MSNQETATSRILNGTENMLEGAIAKTNDLTPSPLPSVTLHGRTYRAPLQPTVIVCIDGFDPTYLDHGLSQGSLPNLQRWIDQGGFRTTAHSCMPSLTNPNNVSIITGASPEIHGIAGNYIILEKEDREQAASEPGHDDSSEYMILDGSLVRGSTILAEFASAGVRVAAITAKDKLRRILDYGLPKAPQNGALVRCFSAQNADEATLAWLGRAERPDQYSGELSLCVLDAGIKLLQEGNADLLYLTLSDYVQHKYAPGEPEADEFMSIVDARLGAMASLGALVAVTGDHGMSDKSSTDGSPNVLFLQDVLEEHFGLGCARVVCPITDPFVKHHGALGGFVRVHIKSQDGANNGSDVAKAALVREMVEFSSQWPQVQMALSRDEAVCQCELPLDREGDFVVIAKAGSVIGSKEEEHDLTALAGHRLRSHGGFSEQEVPLLLSGCVQLEPSSERQWRNFDAFDLALNYGQ